MIQWVQIIRNDKKDDTSTNDREYHDCIGIVAIAVGIVKKFPD